VYIRGLIPTFQLCKRLQEEGIFVNPVVSPGVLPGDELIRISLMATHTDKQIDYALDKLGKVGKELGCI
jgi:7-keto-8-aminopelargonate synthetase-like enzyme